MVFYFNPTKSAVPPTQLVGKLARQLGSVKYIYQGGGPKFLKMAEEKKLKKKKKAYNSKMKKPYGVKVGISVLHWAQSL